MKLAVLPFAAVDGAPAELGRQIANFTAEAVRSSTEADIQQVNFLAQVEQGGIPRVQVMNLSDGLVERPMLEQIFSQSGVDLVMDGVLRKQGDAGYSIELRFSGPASPDPVYLETFDFTALGFFPVLRTLMAETAARLEKAWPPTPRDGGEGQIEVGPDGPVFGTDQPQAFLDFLQGYDAITYIQQAQGRVVQEFSPDESERLLLSAVKADPQFEGAYNALITLIRMCAANQLGSFETARDVLKELQELAPTEFAASFALGEVYQAVGDLAHAADEFEKSVKLNPTDPALYVRLGIAQMQGNMPVNAERNFRKAFELEGPDKPSADYIAIVLGQTNRGHEIPALWKGLVAETPDNSSFHAKLAMSLLQSGQEAEGDAAFETALETVTEKAPIKRFYAPRLAQKGELDRAMDFYEDVLDENPNDIGTLIEYAQTLQKADRQFEIPPVLQTVLQSNPDPNTRAQTMAWLIEIEQPKRVESVGNAEKKIADGDAAGAARDLKPLKSWMAEYWKFWGLYANALNTSEQYAEAEEAARKLLELFPGCEPGYGELVRALSGQEKHDEAYNMMRGAAMNLPQSLPVQINLALAAKRAGHSDEARELARMLREAVGPNEELDPVFAEIEG